VLALVTLAVVLAARPLFSRDRAASGTSAPVIAVLSMDLRGTDSTLQWLEDGLPQMIDGKLARVQGINVVAPERVQAVEARRGRGQSSRLDDIAARDLARRVGATLVARGTIGRDGSQLVLDLTLHDVASGDLLRSAVLTRSDALALADEAAARIVDAANVNAPGPHYAELETTSLAAYQHYMRAIDAGQAGHNLEHRRELDAAIALDSGFISVVRARLNAAIADQDTALSRKLREAMRRHSSRATEFDRLHQDANDAYLNGERERSEALVRALVRKYPRDPRAYQLMGGILGTHGRFDEAERVAIQAYALDSLAMEAGSGPCTQCLGFSGIVHLHWVRRGFDGALAWSRRWIRAQNDAPAAWAALAWTYSYMQRHDSALAAMERAVSLAGGEAWATGEYTRMSLVARRYDAADSAIRVMEAGSAQHREEAFDLRSLLERERGRFRASSAVMSRLASSFPAASGFAEMIRSDNLRLLGDFSGAAARYDAMVHNADDAPPVFPLPSFSARAYCWNHALAADAYSPTGDTIRLLAIADTLEAACTRSFYGRDWRLFHHVRGLVALHGRRYAEAERELALAVWAPVEGWSRTAVVLARAQAAQGRVRDAIGTLRTAYATRLDAMGRYAPISELDYVMADLFAQAGERDSARVYADHVRRAWSNADPEIERLLVRLPKDEERVVARASRRP
jgi:TolB-like protein